MKKRLQKVFAMLLALSMVMSLMSVTAFAEGEGTSMPTNAHQIEANASNTEDGYAYHTLNKSGNKEGSVDSAINSAGVEGKGSVTVSKTITPTTTENEFNINLMVQTTENFQDLELSADAAVVLVLDTSGSMQWDMDGEGWCCYIDEDGNQCPMYGKKSTESSCPWYHIWSIDPETNEDTSRFRMMADSLDTFLNNFASDAEDSQRMVSVVTFGQESTIDQEWVDVTTTDGMASAKTAVSYKTLTSDPYSQTAQGVGLANAITLMNDEAIKDIPNRYVILLTDGRPEGPHGEGSNPLTDNTSGAHTERMAAKLESECDTLLYVIGFGTSAFKMYDGKDTPVDTWLQNNVATKPECFTSALDADNIDVGLNKIVQTIKAVTSAWRVTDPMGEYIVFDGFEGTESAATCTNNTITWNLGQETVSLVDGVYTYDLQYKIRLDTAKEDFEAGKNYLANGYTDLSYFYTEEVVENGKVIATNTSPIKNIDFMVPAVHGTAGQFAFRKVDSKTGEPMSGVEFTLTHDTACSVCGREASTLIRTATSDANGIVSFTDIPSGHDYIMTETTTPEGYVGNTATYEIVVTEGVVTVDGKAVVTSGDDLFKTVAGEVEGETKSVAKEAADFVGEEGTPVATFFEVKNVPKGSLTITKDVTGARSEEDTVFSKGCFTFELWKEGGETAEQTFSLPVKGEDGALVWSTTIKALDAGNYYVVEKFVTAGIGEGYDVKAPVYSYSGDGVGVVAVENAEESTATVTNEYTYTPHPADLTVHKRWNDGGNNDGIRPDGVIFGLYQDGVLVNYKVLNVENELTATFQYDTWKAYSVQEIGYVKSGVNYWLVDKMPVAEDAVNVETDDTTVPGYTAEWNDQTMTITNTHESEVVKITVEKIWDDSTEGKKLPEKITVILKADGKEVNRADIEPREVIKEVPPVEGDAAVEGETPAEPETVTEVVWDPVTFTTQKDDKTPLYKYNDGAEIVYTVVELINGQEVKEEANRGWVAEYNDTEVDWEVPGNEDAAFDWVKDMTITNSYISGGGGGNTTSVKVTKEWNDDNDAAGVRPDSITVQLLKDGEVYDEVVLNADNKWKKTWSGLSKKAEWNVAEVDVPEGYSSVVTPVENKVNEFVITNTYDTTVIEEETPPLTEIPNGNPPLTEIPDDIPLAEVPKTGDMSALWMALSVLSGTGLAGVSLLGRKKKED